MKMTKGERLTKAIEFLKDEFDSVVIITTHIDSGDTIPLSDQHGNFYAVEGSVQDWMDCNKFTTEGF
jgi:hypothetical protein